MLSGCASNSPNALLKYQPPAPESPAAIIDVGKHGRAWSVDGTETPSFANTLRLAPGEHRVGLNCLSCDISTAAVISAAAAVGGAIGAAVAASAIPEDKPPSTLQFVLVTGRFEAGKTYYSRCVAADGNPHAWLADSPDGIATNASAPDAARALLKFLTGRSTVRVIKSKGMESW